MEWTGPNMIYCPFDLRVQALAQACSLDLDLLDMIWFPFAWRDRVILIMNFKQLDICQFKVINLWFIQSGFR